MGKYKYQESEKKWQKYWNKEGIYKFKNKGNIFSIDTPPPTVSGEIHMGHAFSYSHADFIARYQRMKGKNIFYPFGFDNNGLATEKLVEKERKVKATRMDRREFAKLCLEVSKKYEKDFREFWGNLGLSVDWSLLYSTINKEVQKISQYSFIELYKKRREYRKEAPHIWCPECQTAIAQVELEDKELESSFNDILFEVEGKEIIISTTRPELLPAIVAIFIHPEDKRYRNLTGKKAKVPLFDLEVPILKDKRVDMDKGTGIVMCCTFGDQTDMEWYQAYNLDLRMAVNKDGTLNEKAGKYKGLKIKEARKEIIKDLKEKKLLLKEKQIKHIVNVHERCGTEIEILVTKQWFIKYLDLKQEFLRLGRKLNWYPKHMRNRYENWVKGLQWDWCISRQRFFGVPIPVWYCDECGKVNVPDKKDLPVDPLKNNYKGKCECGSKEFTGEKDVLDTWATSSLTPQINAKWGNKSFIDRLFPMSLRPQAHDIISFWLFNTIVKSYLHHKKLPWKDTMISGWGLDPNGKKMSKSKGNNISPIDLLKKYPADAIRFWAASSKLGADTPYKEKEVVSGYKTITKLSNASRFAIMHLKDYKLKKPKKLEIMDVWLLSKLNRLMDECTKAFDNYEYSKVKLEIENFFWNVFCDYYLEIIKDRIYNPEKRGKEGKLSAQYTLYNALLSILKMFAPIMPHITEEIYQDYFKNKENVKSIHVSQWPKHDRKMINEHAEKTGGKAVEIISKVRKYKSENNLALKAEINLQINKEDEKIVNEVLEDLRAVTKAREIIFGRFNIKE